jgi:hypothetical protein
MGAITPEDMRRFVMALESTIDAMSIRPLYHEVGV